MRILIKQLKNLFIITLVALILIFLAIIPKDPFSFTMKFNVDHMLELYITTIKNLISGEGLGKAETGAFIFEEVIRNALRSIKLILPSFFISITIGVLIGLIGFKYREKWFGKFIQSINLLFSTLPDFFLFILVQYGLMFAVRFGFPQLDLFGHEHWYNAILPIFCLSLYPILYMYRITITNLESEETKEYVKTAISKGKSETYIIFSHLLWNTWGSILTNSRTVMLFILTSLPIIELLAYYRGVGYYLMKSVQEDQIMVTVGYLFPFLIIMFITMFMSDMAKHFLIPFTEDTQKSVRPIGASKLRIVLLSLLTFLWNGVLFIRQFPLLVISGLFLALILFFSFIGPGLSIVDKDLTQFMFLKDDNGKLIVPPLPPSGEYWFGTDRKGVDLFSLIVLGAKETLLIVCLVSLVRFMIAIPLGYFASRNIKIFTISLRGLQLLFSYFPILFIVMIFMAIPYFEFTPNRIYWMVSLMALVEIGRIAQIYKEEFGQISSQEFVLAGVSVGTSKWKLFANYYFPYLKKKSIIYFTTDLGRSLFLLAQFGFISVFLSQEYVQDETGRWFFENRSLAWPVLLSNSLNDIREAIWIPFFASACIAFTILTFSFLGEGLKIFFNKKWVKVERAVMETRWNRFVKTFEPKKVTPKRILVSASVAVIFIVSTITFLSSKGYIGDDVPSTVQIAQEEDRMVKNVEVFSKVYGYVRYFHPSDQAAFMDWDKFAVYGIQEIKTAKDDKELRRKLEELFYPIAPTMKFYQEGEEPEDPFQFIGSINRSSLQLVAWQHQGPGIVYAAGSRPPRTQTDDLNLYQSQRVYVEETQQEVTEGLFELIPQKEKVIKEKVGEDLYVQLPIVLYSTEEEGTLGYSEESNLLFMEIFRDVKDLDMNELDLQDEDIRLADIVIAWNKIQHFYPNFVGNRSHWGKELQPALKGAIAASNEKEFIQVFKKMLTPLEDGQADVYVWGSHIKYNLPFHLGIEDGALYVTASAPDSPIQKGDIIISKDGKASIEELKELAQLQSGSSQYKIYQGLKAYTEGEKGQRVRLNINRNGVEKEVLMTFEKVHEVDEFNRTDIVRELGSNQYYVNLNGTKMEDIRPYLDTLLQAKGVIFDLRGTPDLSTRELLSYMVSEKTEGSQYKIPQIILPDYEGVSNYNRTLEEDWVVEPVQQTFSGKLVFLSYEGTKGDAESYLNFVSENNLGDIVGVVSAGSGGLVNTDILPGELYFSWTGMKVMKADGSVLNGKGVPPTMMAATSRDGIVSERDEFIEKAVSLLETKTVATANSED
ncbi:ABC transporter permease subunit [Cytobacillus sp. FJAT-54145]|uniref:ABC transporter permease subunit n=1 Tax=Cytobacillus spartinae TaxID=3299023 RepID=A0ABW6K6Q4_9BACI